MQLSQRPDARRQRRCHKSVDQGEQPRRASSKAARGAWRAERSADSKMETPSLPDAKASGFRYGSLSTTAATKAALFAAWRESSQTQHKAAQSPFMSKPRLARQLKARANSRWRRRIKARGRARAALTCHSCCAHTAAAHKPRTRKRGRGLARAAAKSMATGAQPFGQKTKCSPNSGLRGIFS